MELWEWAVLAAFGAVVVIVLCLRVLNRTRRGRAILGLSMREKVRFGDILLRDPHVPAPAKMLLALLVAYLAMPFDLIPDFVPVAGHLDDFALLAVIVAIVLRLAPTERIDRALLLARAEAEGSPQRLALPPG